MSAQPRMAHGLPYCAEDACEEYDGKRCALMGCRPSRMCEPAVGLMQLKIERVEALCDEYRTSVWTADIRKALRGDS